MAAVAAAGGLLAGCGGSSGDVIAIEVFGGELAREHRIVVANDGRARCDGAEARPISSEDLIEAREVATDLADLADRGASFGGSASGARERYVARTRDGAVRWVEGIGGLPPPLPRVQLLALRLRRELCAGDQR